MQPSRSTANLNSPQLHTTAGSRTAPYQSHLSASLSDWHPVKKQPVRSSRENIGLVGPESATCRLSLSLRSMSGRRGRLHELTPCRQAEIERVQIVLSRSQSGLPRTTGSASPVFGRTPNAGLKSLRMVLAGVGTTKVANYQRRRRIVSDPYRIRDRSANLFWKVPNPNRRLIGSFERHIQF